MARVCYGDTSYAHPSLQNGAVQLINTEKTGLCGECRLERLEDWKHVERTPILSPHQRKLSPLTATASHRDFTHRIFTMFRRRIALIGILLLGSKTFAQIPAGRLYWTSIRTPTMY